MSGMVPGINPDMNQGGAYQPPAIPARLAPGGMGGGAIAQSPEAQRALWAQANGIDPTQPLNDYGRYVMSQFQNVGRSWLGAMLLAGNPVSAVPQLINQLATAAQGPNYDEFLRGSTGAFLGNQGLTGRLAQLYSQNPREAQGMLGSIIGLGQAPMDRVFGQIANEQFGNLLGQYQLQGATTGQGNGPLLDFIRNSDYAWLLGR